MKQSPATRATRKAVAPAYATQAQLDAAMRAFAAALAQVGHAAAAPPGHIDSRLGYRLERVVRSPAQFGLAADAAAAFRKLVARFDEAAHADSARELRRASGAFDDGWSRRPPPI